MALRPGRGSGGLPATQFDPISIPRHKIELIKRMLEASGLNCTDVMLEMLPGLQVVDRQTAAHSAAAIRN